RADATSGLVDGVFLGGTGSIGRHEACMLSRTIVCWHPISAPKLRRTPIQSRISRGTVFMTYRVGVIAGDGIGPEVVAQGLKALRASGVEFETVDYDLGAHRYLETGEVLPDETLADMRALDAILLGAVGDPRVPPGILARAR